MRVRHAVFVANYTSVTDERLREALKSDKNLYEVYTYEHDEENFFYFPFPDACEHGKSESNESGREVCHRIRGG